MNCHSGNRVYLVTLEIVLKMLLQCSENTSEVDAVRIREVHLKLHIYALSMQISDLYFMSTYLMVVQTKEGSRS